MNAQHYAAENQENKFKILRQNELSSPSVSRTPSPKTLVPKHRHSLKYSVYPLICCHKKPADNYIYIYITLHLNILQLATDTVLLSAFDIF